MSKNPGRRVKTLAVLLLILHTVVGLVLGILAAVAVQSASTPAGVGDISALQGIPGYVFPIVGALIGYLIGYINTLVLYAFGSLVEEAQTIRTEMMGLCMDVAEIRIKTKGARPQEMAYTPVAQNTPVAPEGNM